MGIRQKIQILQVLFHLGAVYCLYLYRFELKYFLMLSVPSYFLVSRIGNDIGFHRLFCHRTFKASSLVEFSLLILGSLDLKGSSIGWSALHLAHHRNSDTDRDPHGGSNFLSMIKNWFLFYDLNDTDIVKQVHYLISDPRHRFFHKHYFKIVAATYIVLFLVLPLKLYAYIVIFPAIWSFHASAAINVICHNFGYRNFSTNDHSYNNLWVHLFTLGGGLHNNHHEAPKSHKLETQWYELDINGKIIEFYLGQTEKKRS